MHNAFYGDIVRFGGAGSEDDLFRRGVDQCGDLCASGLDGLVGLPAVEVGARVRVAVACEVVRKHGVENPRVDGGGGLHIEVEWSSGDFDSFYCDSRCIVLC